MTHWECVVQVGQTWTDPQGRLRLVLSLSETESPFNALVRFTHGTPARASVMCGGEGWERQPDAEWDGDTLVVDLTRRVAREDDEVLGGKTIVGVGRARR